MSRNGQINEKAFNTNSKNENLEQNFRYGTFRKATFLFPRFLLIWSHQAVTEFSIPRHSYKGRRKKRERKKKNST